MSRAIVVWLCVVSWGLLASAARAQAEDVAASQCADVSILMQQNRTPYDFALGGGSLQEGVASGTLARDHYADFWSFQLASEGQLTLMIDAVSGAPLEFALFRAMYAPSEGYRRLEAGQTYTIDAGVGPYTLVVRRVHVADPSEAAYRLTVSGLSLQAPPNPQVSTSNGKPYSVQPIGANGLMSMTVTGVQYRFHPGAIGKVNEQRSDGSQVYFPNKTFSSQSTYTLYTGGWTQNIALLGGDLAINNGTDRIFFLENFAFQGNLAGSQGTLLLNNLTFPDGTKISINSADIYGLWITNECTGFKLKDGRSFVAATAPQDRVLSIKGSLDAFALQINALNANNELVSHTLTMSWTGVSDKSEVSLLRSVLHLLLVGERELSLQSTNLTFTSQPPGENYPGRVDATLADLGAQVVLDWFNMRVFGLTDDVIALEFLDAPRGKTTRSGAALQRFEALGDVIHIVYQPQGDVAGEERLMLPAEDSYLEMITPPGDPAFDGRALPDQDGFAARSLNNLGGECYPVSNILPQANCAPNGTPNAANGNLWVALTDAFAHGGWIDLALTRSYNSRGTRWTGPFGQGWTTPFLLDYNTAYDTTSNSRPIKTDNPYRMALDVRYAPRGLLTFISATGSQHPFVPYDTGTPRVLGAPEEYRALTMPGWVLTRAGLRSPWELRQDDGLIYQFDRAGRLLRYGYPLAGRMIEIAYPRTTLGGPGSLGSSTPVIITDTSGEGTAPRRIELYYNADHQIIRSVLRDMTSGEPSALADCDPKNNCFETLYVYDADRLTQVLYSDGQLATYGYDEAGHLTDQTDAYAPLSPHTTYTYSENGDLKSVTLANGSETLLWRSLSYVEAEGERQVTVTDELGHTRTYAYTRLPDSLRRARQDRSWQGANKTTFVLTSETSPLADTNAYEAIPQTYTWEKGFLKQFDTRGSGEGRLAVDFNYTPTGKLSCISCDVQGLPQLNVKFVAGDPTDTRTRPEDFLAQLITFADGSSISYEYDDRRLVTRMTDQTGATYRYVWSLNAPVVLESKQRENDGVVWEYSYNALGLMTKSVERHAGEAADTAYTITYTWDGLGRLTGISDSLIGAYTLAYSVLEAAGMDVTLTDPIGATTVRRYDARGRLLESSLRDAAATLRRDTYAYDLLGRLTEEARWLGEGADSRPLRTTYTYEPQETLDMTGLVPDTSTVTIRGTRTAVTDAAGTQRFYTYDALGRLRETFDETQRRSYYDYSTADSGKDYGLRITQYEKLSGIAAVNVNSFRFDSRWQLIGLERGAERWTLTYDQGVSTRIRALDSSVGNRTVTLQQVVWNWGQGALPQNVLLTLAPIDLTSRYRVNASNTPQLQFSYDFLGRPLGVVDGANTSTPMAYCPQAGGLHRTLYGPPGTAAITCDSTNVQAAVIVDMHNRLVEYRDISGTRTFSYFADTVAQQWVVEGQMTGASGQAFSWLMRYNAAGDLIQWLDEAGTTYDYTYDALGRLTSVTVADQPETSFTFVYNDANHLTSITDGLGRGYLYNYNETEQVISQLNANTADALSYTYTPTGQLSTIVSPVGNATTFLYDDATNPTRPTAVIDPTGNQHRFQWDDASNSLIYTNPLNDITRYRFDGTGLLWRIDDPLVVVPDAQRDTYRTHEIHYDSAGRLTDWLFNVNADEPQHLTVGHDAANSWAVSEAQGDTTWTQNLTFAPSGELTRVGDVTFAYDPLARLSQIAAGSLRWDLAWQAGTPDVTLSDPFGLKTLTHYDALSRALSETINETTSTYTYTPASLSSVTLDVNRPGIGRQSYSLSPGSSQSNTTPTITLLGYGQRTQYIFNADGLLVDIISDVCSKAEYPTWEACRANNIPFWTTHLGFIYDADHRPIRVTDEDGNTRTFAYDDADNLITYQTASGRTYSYAYDTAQRLISLTSATGVKLLFGYDARDHLLGICRTRTDFTGDYAACAQQTDLTDGSGVLESYGYDTLDRLVRRSFPSGASTTDVPYEYDEKGRLIAIGAERFSYNTLDLLERLDTRIQTYDYQYRSLTQLAKAGNIAFVYDDTGRVTGYSSGGQTFSLLYSDDNSLYAVQDAAGNRIEYTLDPHGFLSGLNFNGDNVIKLDYIYDPREPAINLQWNQKKPQTTTITSDINLRKQTQNQTYLGAGDFTVFYNVTSSGLIQRQNIASLPGRNDGYIIVRGYDNDERPLTMRVTDSGGRQVLYTQSITYNTAGMRIGEQLQYADGTQVLKTLTYQDNSQLASELILIIRPLHVAASMIWLLPLFLLRRRRGRLLLGLVLLGLVALPLLRAQTPQAEERYQLDYTYDSQGNLSQVALADGTKTCATFNYDAANRLTRIERGDFTASYTYDAYDRLSQMTDPIGTINLSYQGGTGRILGVQGAKQTYYLQTADQPAFAALDAAGAVTWLITDGRQRIAQTYQDGDNPRKDLWLFDLLGRALILQPPGNDDTFDPCVLNGKHAVPDTVRLQSDPKGMVWDAASGLYFFQGRAYDADLGRFMQRDPQGPDALGNVYDGETRQTVPLARKTTPVYAEGLSILRQAMTSIDINDQLSADSVKARYLPTGSRSLNALTMMTQQSRQPFDKVVNGLSNLPLWLQSNYNLPAPGLDAAGRYSLSQAAAPGQGGTRQPFVTSDPQMLPSWRDMVLASVVPPLETLRTLADPVTQPPMPGLRVYTGEDWMQRSSDLSSLLQTPISPVRRDATPDTILVLLPRTLAAPEQAAYTLDTVAFLDSLPKRPAHQWIQEALTQALPAHPDLPPQTLEMWEKTWFTSDLFGLGALSQQMKPPFPFVPFYEWGGTPDQLNILK